MTDFKGTPGPWEVAVAGWDAKGNTSYSLKGHEKACIADAKLIESAPDLVAALKEAIDALADGLWDYGPGQDEHERCDDVLERCRAVMDKATRIG